MGHISASFSAQVSPNIFFAITIIRIFTVGPKPDLVLSPIRLYFITYSNFIPRFHQKPIPNPVITYQPYREFKKLGKYIFLITKKYYLKPTIVIIISVTSRMLYCQSSIFVNTYIIFFFMLISKLNRYYSQ